MRRKRSFNPPSQSSEAWLRIQIKGLRAQLAEAKAKDIRAEQALIAIRDTLCQWCEQEPTLETLVATILQLNRELESLRKRL